ncbi:histidine phosphatase family protein [Planococcus sp. ISL-110]|uniref:histidine phosphatase family protein n=1 Tax=Planococcus sp. ISL-110 TaxID=2819167 RepID=UPI001BE51C42|nr:histidine phosphatase family protein [Planococcus sp. ISL-110]MBT2570875.1 histidine phosphatase family protein [Planococcus sp. ISL-110]
MDQFFVLRLIRHAPTRGNQQKRYIGWTDEAILPFDAEPDLLLKTVVGSDLKRCRQTAAVLFPNAVYRANRELRECHFGQWETKTYEELKDIGLYQSWIDDPWGIRPPGGESLADMAERVERGIRKLPDDREVTLVLHGGPIRYLMAEALGEKFQDQIALHGGCHTLTWESRQAFEERALCTSFSVEPLTANGNM